MAASRWITTAKSRALRACAGLVLVLCGALLGGPFLIVSVAGAVVFTSATARGVRGCRCRA